MKTNLLKKENFEEILELYNIGEYSNHKLLEDVLENDVSVRGFFILMILTLVTTILIIGDKYRKRKFKEETIQYDSIEKIFSEDNTFLLQFTPNY